MLAAIISGTILGLAAGFSPGPLTVLVISITLSRSARDGLLVSLAPMLTDAPIILASLFLIGQAAALSAALGAISLAGAAFVLYLARGTWRAHAPTVIEGGVSASSLRQGFLVNLLSPNPYLFWLTVGAPQLLIHSGQGWPAAVGFLASFYVCLVGGKMLIAVVCGRARSLVTGRPYLYVMRFLAVMLVLFSLLLLKQGLGLLGAW